MDCDRFRRDNCTPECKKWLICEITRQEREAQTDDPDKDL